MNIKERKEKLIQAGIVLKKEFIGIDSIIDQILENITPWYVTPEVITRPSTISLWGLTGTGKTSVVKRLLELLEISGNSLYFNCATEASSTKDSLDTKLEEFYDESEDSGSITQFGDDNSTLLRDPRQSIIILDEFQNCRTIDEHGSEKDRSQTAVIWQLLDSGNVEIINYSWERNKLLNAIDDLAMIGEKYPGVELNDGNFTITGEELEKIDIMFRNYLEYEGLYRFKEGDKSGVIPYDLSDFNQDEGDSSEYIYPQVLDKHNRERFIIKTCNYNERGSGWEIIKRLRSAKTLGEYCQILIEISKIFNKPKQLDFSRALIFVIGNLDEAFGVGDGVDPDIDADILHRITSSVTITDVKNSLKKRFRLEQISRLGNNMVLYPSLKKTDFEGIIELELNRVIQKFKDLTGFEILFSDKMKKLIYSESVYPIQGVRPIHSTITSLITPKLSKVLLERPDEKCNSATLDTLEDNFEKDSINITIKYSNGVEVEQKQDLVLGSLRDVTKYPKILLHSVHEAGHAVVYSVLTGKLPEIIVSMCAQGGGYMWRDSENEKIEIREAQSVDEITKDVMVSYAGALTEEVVFVQNEEDRNMLSVGAGADIADAWETLSHAFYDCGIGSNMMRYRCTDIYPLGLDPNINVEDGTRNAELIKLSNKLIDETYKIIRDNLEFIKEVARFLGKNRKMSRDEFKVYYDKYCGKPEPNISEWYSNRLG